MGIGVIPLIQIGVAAAGALATASAAQRQAAAAGQREAAVAQEARRQAGVVGRQAQEQKSDRVRQANRDFASAMVGLADSSAGSITASRFATQIGFEEGIDLARIDANASEEIGALQSNINAAAQRARNARSIASATTTSALLGAAGSGLQIAGDERRRSLEREITEDRV